MMRLSLQQPRIQQQLHRSPKLQLRSSQPQQLQTSEKGSAKEQPATAASDEPKASAKEQLQLSANTSAPGSLTVVGHSTDERFRITYETRQLISGLDGSGSKPEDQVGKGILVVPGTWARLSNISDDGNGLSTKSFRFAPRLLFMAKEGQLAEFLRAGGS